MFLRKQEGGKNEQEKVGERKNKGQGKKRKRKKEKEKGDGQGGKKRSQVGLEPRTLCEKGRM